MIRNSLNLFLAVVVLSGWGVFSASAGNAEPSGKENLITLQNRIFSPEPGISTDLIAKMAMESELPVQGIVQLLAIPTPADRQRLDKAGVKLHQFLGGTAYLALIARSSKIQEAQPFLRWAGPLKPEDKLEITVLRKNYEKWAYAKDGAIKLLIYFPRYVDKKTAETALNRHAPLFKPYGQGNKWAVEIPEERILDLAGEDAVQRIEQGPPPKGLLNPKNGMGGKPRL